MRIQWVAIAATLALLGGCDASQQGRQAAANAQAAPAIAAGTAITGSVTLRDTIPVASGAKLSLRLVDLATPDVPIADKTIDVTGGPPYAFSVDFDRSRITADRTYTLNAMLTDGDRRFMPALAAPVLTHGAGASVQITLAAEATPGEKLKEEYAKLQQRIGAMKKVDGTYTTETASIGWDAFSEGPNVRFMRVNTEQDAGGRSAVYYAYTKDGKPMVIQQKGGSLLGWGENGELLVNEKHGGGQVAEADIAAMREAAMKALELSQGKADAAHKR